MAESVSSLTPATAVVIPANNLSRPFVGASAVNVTDEHTTCKEECRLKDELIASLKTTVEVLEAELLYYRNKYLCQEQTAKKDEPEWKLIQPKRLRTCNTKTKVAKPSTSNFGHTRPPSNIKNKLTITENKSRNRYHSQYDRKVPNSPRIVRSSLPFKNMTIYGDSHSRFIPGLITERLHNATRVFGFCKPSARLQSIAPLQYKTTPEGCSVIISGTNDVAAGQQSYIYRHLEEHISALRRSSKVLVATLPCRYDLPPHHCINEETLFVNAFIMEVCARYEGVEVIDCNSIPRRGFTRHGMHLNLRGKRQLVELILKGAKTLQQHTPSKPLRSTASLQNTTDTTRTLQHITYSEAVKRRSSSATDLTASGPNQCPDITVLDPHESSHSDSSLPKTQISGGLKTQVPNLRQTDSRQTNSSHFLENQLPNNGPS